MYKTQQTSNNLDIGDKGQHLYQTQRQDYYPHKSARNHDPMMNDQYDNCLSFNEEDNKRLFSINSPLSSMRFGDEQRKILLDGKRTMDNFAYKFSEEESDFVQFDNQEYYDQKKKSSFTNGNLNNRDQQHEGILEFSQTEDIRSSGGLGNDKDFAKNNKIMEFPNNNTFTRQTNQSKDKRKHSLFIESLGAEFMKYDDGKSFKSYDQNSQYEINQFSISPTKNYHNHPKHIVTLTAQNSYSNSQVSKNFQSINMNNNEVSLGINNQLNETPQDQNTFKKDTNKSDDNDHTIGGFKGVWKKKSLIIIYLARKFLVDVKKYSTSWRFKNLTLNQFQAINDVSCDENSFLLNSTKYKTNRFLNSCSNALQRNKTFTKFIMQNFIIIRPDSPFKVLWDCFILMVLFINIFYIPIKLCFTEEHELILNPLIYMFLYDLPGWLVVTMVFVAHFCGCSFFYVGTLDIDENALSDQQSWVQKAHILDKSFEEKYTTCLYWATITMITVGYGDITPVRKREKQLILFITLFSCGVYAYSINVIGIILQEITKERQILKKKLSVVTSYMKKRGTSNVLQQKIKKYFNYMHEEDLKFNEGGEIFFNEVKGQLKIDVLSEIYFKVLNQSNLFRMNFSSQFLKSLSLVMQEQKYVCDEVILDIGDDCNNLFFISRGEVQSLIDGGIAIGCHQKGTIFDEIQFFSEGKSEIQYKSNGITTMVFIRKENFVKVLQRYPKDYEKYCMMRDKIVLYRNLRNFEHKCQLCSSFKHTIRDCLFVNPQFNHKKILYEHNKVTMQERDSKFIRIAPVASLSEFKENLREVRDTVIQYLIDRNPFDENPQDLLTIVQQIVEYDSVETNQFKITHHNIQSAQLIQDNPKLISTPDIISMQAKKISFTNFQELENESLQKDNDISPHNKKFNNRYPNRLRKGSSFSSINNDSTPQTSSSQQAQSQTPHSLQVLQQKEQQQKEQQKNQAFSEANQSINIQLYTPNSIDMINNPKRNFFSQVSRLKQIDELEEQMTGNTNSQQDFVLTHQQTTVSHEKFLHIPSDVVSNNIPMNSKKISSQITLNSQKGFFKQASKSSHFMQENLQGVSASQQISKQEGQNQSTKYLNNAQENSLYIQENSMLKLNKTSFNNEAWQVQTQRQNFMVMEDFDKSFPFQIYFPESNVDKVLLVHMKRRKTIQNVQKVFDMKIQEDKLKQIRSNLNLNKERSRYKQSTKIHRSSHQLNQSSVSLHQINHEIDNLDKLQDDT